MYGEVNASTYLKAQFKIKRTNEVPHFSQVTIAFQTHWMQLKTSSRTHLGVGRIMYEEAGASTS